MLRICGVILIASLLRSGTEETEDDSSAGSGSTVRRSPASDDTTSADDDRSSGSRLRKVLLGLGLLGAGAVAVSRMRRKKTLRSVDELRETVNEALPETVTDSLPMGSERQADESDGRTMDGSVDDSAMAGTGTDPVDIRTDVGPPGTGSVDTGSAELDAEQSDEERSGDLEEQPDEEPAEPGEMMVDDNVEEDTDEDAETSAERE